MNIVLRLLSSVKDSYLPALIVLASMFFCALNSSPTASVPLWLNLVFLVCCFLNLALLLFIHDFKNIFFMLIVILLYLSFSKVAPNPQIAPIFLSRWLTLITPFNLLLIFHINQKEKNAFYLLCFFLIQAALIENLCLSGLSALPDFTNAVAVFLWAILFLYLLISISIYPSIKNNAYFFKCILVFCAFFFFQSPYLFLFFLFGAVLADFAANIHDTVYGYFRDSVTGCFSKNSFPANNTKKLPAKYTIAFFCIDNYHKILRVFKQNLTDKLTKMVLKRLTSLDPNALVYRLKADEFCFIFFEQDIRQTYEKVENMRRLIAGTEFVLTPKKILKLTVTPVVSEKHRNDANAAVVLERMHKNFDRRYKFTQNITFCEELEQKKTKRTPAR